VAVNPPTIKQVSEMSKFIEKLKQVLQPPVQSMGFKAFITEQSKPRIQLVINITGVKTKTQIKEPAEADALLFSNTTGTIGEKLSGMWLARGDSEEVEKAIQAGADFVVIPVDGEVLPSDKKIGKIIQIGSTITDVMLRTVSELPVDAVLLNEEKESELMLSWKRLMLIRRFAGLTGKPLLIEVPPIATENELQQIWEAGVSGIIVKTEAEQAEAVALNLRNIIDKLTFPAKGKKEKSMAIVPSISTTVEEPKEDNDGDDGDDE
jgi:hypothetical protein